MAKQWTGWGKTTSGGGGDHQATGLHQIMQAESTQMRGVPEVSRASSGPTSKKKAVWKSLDVHEAKSPPPPVNMAVTNPWNRAPAPAVAAVAPPTKQQNGNTFKEIMDREAQRRQNFERAATKSLASTQDEERAIVELEAFYNVANVFDETITVERAQPKEMATPIWNPKKIQRS